MDCNSNIRDFSSVYTSREIELPKNFPKSYPNENKIKHLTKVREIFDPQKVEKFEREIRASYNFGRPFSFEGGKRHFYVQDDLDPYHVQFKNGQVQINSIKSSNFHNQPRIIKKILIIAMERLAKELNWTDTTHKISCMAMDYQFLKGAKEPLPWHTDDFYRCGSGASTAEYSFIILLSNPNDPETGWKGGDLSYTTARDFKLGEIEYEERLKIRALRDETHGEVLNEPNSSVWQMQPEQNNGILFGNRGMKHKVTAMEPLKDNGRRLILTVFDFGETDTVNENEKLENEQPIQHECYRFPKLRNSLTIS